MCLLCLDPTLCIVQCQFGKSGIAVSSPALAFKFQRNKLVLHRSLVKIQYCLRDGELSSSTSDRKCSNFESCDWRAILSDYLLGCLLAYASFLSFRLIACMLAHSLACLFAFSIACLFACQRLTISFRVQSHLSPCHDQKQPVKYHRRFYRNLCELGNYLTITIKRVARLWSRLQIMSTIPDVEPMPI